MLTNLPYANSTFDLVFSADVLEHIHEDEAEAVVKELVRVSRRHLFLSISLKPHTKVHELHAVFSATYLSNMELQMQIEAAAELVRASRRHLFLSISPKPHTR